MIEGTEKEKKEMKMALGWKSRWGEGGTEMKERRRLATTSRGLHTLALTSTSLAELATLQEPANVSFRLEEELGGEP